MLLKVIPHISSIQISKRKEFVLITVFLTGFMLATQLVPDAIRYWALLALAITTFAVSALGLRENMHGWNWITLLILPTLFTLSVGLFYFLLPVRWLTRVPIALLFAIGIYATLLVENIYSVAVNRSIQLLRVAYAVGFLLTLITIFLLMNTLYSLHLDSYINMILVFIAIIPLSFQSLWSVDLDEIPGRVVVLYTFGIALMISEIGYIISFWPLKPIIISIFMTTISYALIGIAIQYLSKRLFKQNILEYIQVVAIVTTMIMFTTKYR